MEYELNVASAYLGIPVAAEQPQECLEIFLDGEKLYEFQVPVAEEAESDCDYYSYINVEKYFGKKLTLKGDMKKQFFEGVIQKDAVMQEPLVRPLIHFTAQRGWINDPNGLVYADGVYHLFFQYNPMNTQWQNMSWGHAVSKDLLRFTQMDTALYPDENGTMFSGCGLVNTRGLLNLPKHALLFYYSAAGDTNDWSRGKAFTQRIACSTDGGKSFVKLPGETVGVIDKDTRDPKIFWHEESGAYVMALWLKENEFGFLRSENLQDWHLASTIDLEKAWECPDLFPLKCENETYWVFTSADGFYYLGQFDGYTYHTDGIRRDSYLTGLPYAAQTFSGISDRTVSIPWLRTKNKGKLYTGAMGLPRELGLVKRNGRIYLQLLPVKEYEQSKQETCSFSWKGAGYAWESRQEAVTEIQLQISGSEPVEIEFFGEKLTVHRNRLVWKDEETALPEAFEDLHILVDRQIVEIYGNQGTLNVYYETDSDLLQGQVKVRSGAGTGKIYQWKP